MSKQKPPFPFRGPRVMHGGARMLSQGSLLNLAAGAAVRDLPTGVGATAAHAALNTLARMREAETKVRRVEYLVAAWREQCEKQPADSPLRNIVETMIGGIEQALTLKPKEQTNAADAGSSGAD